MIRWVGILKNPIIGTIFIIVNLTGGVLLDLLQNAINSIIIRATQENEIILGLDDAPSHYYVRV